MKEQFQEKGCKGRFFWWYRKLCNHASTPNEWLWNCAHLPLNEIRCGREQSQGAPPRFSRKNRRSSDFRTSNEIFSWINITQNFRELQSMQRVSEALSMPAWPIQQRWLSSTAKTRLRTQLEYMSSNAETKFRLIFEGVRVPSVWKTRIRGSLHGADYIHLMPTRIDKQMNRHTRTHMHRQRCCHGTHLQQLEELIRVHAI